MKMNLKNINHTGHTSSKGFLSKKLPRKEAKIVVN